MLARLGLPLLFMTLAACSGPGDTPQPSESPDVWKPARPVAAKQWTDAEREAWRTDEFLPDTAARLDITNPPEVDLVRWITRDQWDATMSDCLTQAGFPTKPAVGGGLEHDPGIPVDQTPGYHLAIYRCEAQYTLEPKYSQGTTDEQKGLLYDYYVQWLVPCVEEAGAHISDPPSRDTFIQDPSSFSPVFEATTQPLRIGVRELMERCPPRPPSESFYG